MYTTSLKTWARERLGIKTPDDIEEEFTKHRMYLRQASNAVDGETRPNN